MDNNKPTQKHVNSKKAAKKIRQVRALVEQLQIALTQKLAELDELLSESEQDEKPKLDKLDQEIMEYAKIIGEGWNYSQQPSDLNQQKV